MICVKCKQEVADGAYCNLCGARQKPKEKKPRHRANGTGSVYLRKDVYQAVITYYIGGERKTHSKSGFVTKKAALDYIPKLWEDVRKGIKIAAKTLADYFAWFSETAMLKLSSSKKIAYRKAWERLAPIHEKSVKDLGIDDLQCVVDKMAISFYTAKDMRDLLSHLYKRACAEDVVRTNFAQYLVLPTLEEKEASAYTEAEVKAMWLAYEAGDLFAGFPITMIYTGMMTGELLGCKKAMIDFDRQVIIGAGLKTKERRKRPIVIPDLIIPVLCKLCDSHPYKSLVGMNGQKFYAEYHAMAQRLGIRDLPPYSCRHTTATALALGDVVAPSVITKIMRQKQLVTTERYKHIDEQARLEAVNALAVSPITRVEAITEKNKGDANDD